VATTSAKTLVTGTDGLPAEVPADSDIYGSGTIAARPASGTIAGDLYHVQDSGQQLYRTDVWDGTRWRIALNRDTADPGTGDDQTAGYFIGSTWVRTDTDTVFVCTDASTGAANWVDTTAGAGGGETNTGSNVGTDGVGVFDGKVGVDLQFRHIAANSTKITVTLDAADNDIDLDVADASTTQKGAIEIATQAEVDAGTDTVRAVVPDTLDGYALGGDLGGTLGSPTVDDGADSTAIHDDTAGEIAAIAEKASPVSADLLIIEDSAAANVKKRVQIGNLPGGGGGETNTGSNQGTDGVGVFYQKSGVDLQFRHVAPGSNQITTTLNGQDIDIDVVEANIKLDDLGAPDDNTDLDASTSAHGLLPKLANDADKFLNGVGSWVHSEIIQVGYDELTADVSTTSGTFVDVTGLSVTITTKASSDVYALLVASVENSQKARDANIRIQMDGSDISNGAQQRSAPATNIPHALSVLCKAASVSAASHTFTARWRCDGGTMRCNASSSPDDNGMSLLVIEVKA